MAFVAVAQGSHVCDTEWSGCADTYGEALIMDSQAGDREAFTVLVEQHQQRVYAVCFRILGESDAADATQEVFLSMYRNIQHFRGGSFIAWLLRIARNKCYDQLRARKRRPQYSLDADTNPLPLCVSEETPDEHLLGKELAHEVHGWLLTLEPEQRLVVVLSAVEGYSYPEIAAITGYPLGTVKSRLSRGRAQLRKALRMRTPNPLI